MAIRRIRGSQIENGWKDPVNSSSGIASTGPNININAAPNVVDGFTTQPGSRILLRHQTDPVENGIYEVVTPGTGSDGVWKRAADYEVGERINPGTTVLVFEGNHPGQIFYCAELGVSPFIVDIDSTTWQPAWGYDFLAKGDLFIENHNGDVDGTNVTVTTLTPFFSFGPVTGPSVAAYDTIMVFLNGVQLEAGTDYTHDGVDTITLAFPPKAAPGNPDKLKVHYYQYIQ